MAWLLLALAVCGCASQPAVDHSLLVSCPATFMPAMEALGQGYAALRPKVRVLGNPGGSTAAILAVRRSAVDLAVSSRDLTLDEDDPDTRAYLLTRDGLALVTHPSNPLDDLTIDQLTSLLAGTVRDWKELKGPARPILVCYDPSAKRLALPELLALQELNPAHSQALRTPEEVLQAVRGDPGALGFIPWDQAHEGVKVLKIEGVPLTRASMVSGRYPLSRSLFLVRYGESAFEEQGFSDFCLSSEGQKILQKMGYLALR